MFLRFPTVSEDPFRNTPIPHFHVPVGPHGAARAYFESAEFLDGGFACVTGEAGMGKTSLVGRVVTSLPPRVVTVDLDEPPQSADDVYEGILAAFAFMQSGKRRSDLFGTASTVLLRNHADDRRTALIIDDAQDLQQHALEAVTLLADVRDGDQPVLAIMLVGEPGFERGLAAAAEGATGGPPARHFHLLPLNAEQTAEYIRHRLRVAGDAEGEVFTDEACELIHLRSGGVPKHINALCALAMRRSSERGDAVVSGSTVAEVAGDPDHRDAPPRTRVAPPQVPAPESAVPEGPLQLADGPVPRRAAGGERDVAALVESLGALKSELARSTKQRSEMARALEAIQAEKERLAAELEAREETMRARVREQADREQAGTDTDDDSSSVRILSARVVSHGPASVDGVPASDSAAAPRRADGRSCVLVALGSDGRTREHPLEKSTVLLGSGADNDIRIDSAYISPHHAQLVLTDKAAVIGDMNTINGTYVNAQRIRRHVLRDGDVITVGKHRFRYVERMRDERESPSVPDYPTWFDE